MTRIYLDHAATTPADPRVVEAMAPYWNEAFGNPSSAHSFGMDALDAVEQARRQVAGLLFCKPEEVVFTGSGTESDNSALWAAGRALAAKGNHIITTRIEHHAVLHCARFMAENGWDVTYVDVDKYGLVDPDDIRKAVTPKTVLVSVMHANNEIGTLQPLESIGLMLKRKGILFHTDAVQTAGHVPIDVNRMNLDLLSLSGHKLYGPKGVGALFIRTGTPFVPFLQGGGHEKGRRSSTHNVPGIVGLGAACSIAQEEMVQESNHTGRLRNLLRDEILKSVPDISVNGHPDKRLQNNLNVSVLGVDGEALLLNMDLEGVAVSSGSACSSGSGESSHVLKALGLPAEKMQGSLRMTTGRSNTEQEMRRAADIFTRVVKRLRDLSASGGSA
ncbi:cysteine desulfurase [bacterium]|nr:cysteine desulfurase [bacterium]